jgi:hypothetical protein
MEHLSAPLSGKLLSLPTNQKRPAWDIHSSLLRKFVNYGGKNFMGLSSSLIFGSKHKVLDLGRL